MPLIDAFDTMALQLPRHFVVHAYSIRLQHLVPVLLAGSFAWTGCQPPPSSEPDPKNELPFGFIDAPTQGAGVGRQIQMYGWAMDDQGVADIRIFFDGKYVAHTRLTAARPDVTKAHPNYAHGNDTHGWAVTIGVGDAVQPGEHTILAQAVDTKGATRDIGTVAVSVSK